MCEHCEWQARDMAESINISLSPSQIKAYSDLRCRIPTGKEKKEDVLPSQFSDPELFCLLLPLELRSKYMEGKQNIFPEGNFSNPDIFKLIEAR